MLHSKTYLNRLHIYKIVFELEVDITDYSRIGFVRIDFNRIEFNKINLYLEILKMS